MSKLAAGIQRWCLNRAFTETNQKSTFQPFHWGNCSKVLKPPAYHRSATITKCWNIQIKSKLNLHVRLHSSTWDSRSAASGLRPPACPRWKSSRLPLLRGEGVSMPFSIPFSIMSSRPPDATMTKKVNSDGSTAELRRPELNFIVDLKFITEPLRAPPLLFMPYSCLRGSILCVRLVCLMPTRFSKLLSNYSKNPFDTYHVPILKFKSARKVFLCFNISTSCFDCQNKNPSIRGKSESHFLLRKKNPLSKLPKNHRRFHF